MNRVMSFLHPLVGAHVNRRRHSTGRRDGGVDFIGGFESARDFHAEIHIHRLVAARGMVIEEDVVAAGAEARLRPQKLPYFIESRLPCRCDAANRYMATDGRQLHGSNRADGNGSTHMSVVTQAGMSRLPAVLIVSDVLHPIDDLAIELFLNRDVGHGSAGSGAMPVFLAGS